MVVIDCHFFQWCDSNSVFQIKECERFNVLISTFNRTKLILKVKREKMIDQELLQELTESYLKSLMSEATDSLGTDFDSFAPFGELGINSFHVLKIIKKLEADFGTLPKTLLFENFNINDLALYFVIKHDKTLNVKFAVELGNSSQPFDFNTSSQESAETVNQMVNEANEIESKDHAAEINQAQSLAKKLPIVILEKQVSKDPLLSKLVQRLFESYKNETSVSRGTRNIAPYLFIGGERKGYFNFSRSKNIILVYAYTGPNEYLDVVAEELLQYCDDNNFELNMFAGDPIYKVGEVPFSATPFGVVQRVLDLQNFTLKGGLKRRLRYQVSKFEKAGKCHVEEYSCGSNPDVDQNIADIIDQWCETRTMVNPLIYIVKEEILAGKLSDQHRVFITFSNGVLQNAILISSMSSEQNGYLMDLEFYHKNMPLGGLEFAIVKIIETLIAEGCNMLSLGGTYGCKLAASPTADPAIDQILDELREQNIFNDEGNLQFKNKFRPENKTIYLCRAVGSSNPDNVIDIIMMIADPSKTNPSDQILPSPHSIADPMPEKTRAVTGNETTRSMQSAEQNPSGELVIEGEKRSLILSDFGYNPLNIPCEQVEFDLKTDSWAQLKMPYIDKQMKLLHTQLQQPGNLEKSLRGIFPFSYFVLTESGRAAESIFCKAWLKKGIVLQNLLFPTWIFSQIENGFTPEEIPCSEVFNLESNQIYKGELEWDVLQKKVESQSDSIAFVCIEVSDNAVGGHPISMQHLKQVKSLLSKYSIPLVIDGTRVVENAQYVREYETGYAEKDVWTVVQEIYSYADAITVSLAKDFCINKGGLIATNDANLFQLLQELSQKEGSGLNVIDKKLIRLALQNKKQIEIQTLRRMQLVKLISKALLQNRIPVVQPVGGHCILIDVKQVAEFKNFENPVASFVAWLYLNTGIRAGEHSVGMQKNTSLNDLVRLAIPVGLTREVADGIINRLVTLFSRRENIPEIVVSAEAAGSIGNVHANYELKQYHNVSAKLVSQTAARKTEENILQEATPVGSISSFATGADAATCSSENNLPAESIPATVNKTKEIAIIGMSGRYPKAKNLDEMWLNLIDGKDCIGDIPDMRFTRRRQQETSKKYRGGFIDDIDRFDSLFFNISPREAEILDPQERIFLEVAWEALEDAGYYPESLGKDSPFSQDRKQRDIGVFVGAVWTLYQSVGAEERLAGNEAIASSFLWSIANRVSYFMNLSGPSMSVDTACSASLTAIYLAAEAIQKGECSSAIVGGVNLDVHQCKQEITVAGGLLSEDGLCRTFGKGANGYVPGEGVGAIILKPLEQAVQDNDNIYGVIKSIAINHGGRTSGYSVPNPKAQGDLVLAALKKANIDARSIGYIEAHGTGTELGDPIEITGLTNAFQNYKVENQTCAIGSVKTNIGHLEAAAGIAGVCKVLLQMRHRKLVPSLHSTELNEFIEFENSPFYVEQKVEEWKEKEVDGKSYPLRAGISSFGAGGSNAHVIIEKYESEPSSEENSKEQLPKEQIFPLSARNEEQLRESANRLRNFLQRDLSFDKTVRKNINDIAYTLQVGRKSFDHRLVMIAKTKKELVELLSIFIDGKKDEKILSGNVKNTEGLTKLLNRKEKEEFISLLSQSRNAQKLAQLWIDGLLTDWQGMQTQISGRKIIRKRISLPTYPFADKRHWISKIDKQDGIYRSGTALSGMHPLIDSNESTFERQIFKKTFNENEFFIYDHLVSEIPTLPGVGYLDFARKAGEIAAGRKVQKIKNIVWVSPLTVEDSIPNETFIELKPKGDSVQFEVFSESEDGGKQLYSQGKILYATQQDLDAEPEYIDIESIRSRCVKVTDGKSSYPLFKSLGLDLGPSFQVLQDIYKNEDEVLGELKIPDIRLDDFHEYILHPSLVDGSFQAFMGATLGGDASGEMIVPYSLGEVEILHSLTKNCYTYITEATGNKKSNSMLSKKNVLIVDEYGKILIKVKDSVGVPLTDVHEKPAEQNDDDEFSKLYYSSEWENAPLVGELNSDDSLPSILLFDTDEKLTKLYRERLKQVEESDNHIVLVKPGKTFKALKNKTYTINPNNEKDFAQLFESLKKNDWEFGKVCFAWPTTIASLPTENDSSAHDKLLQEPLEKGVHSFLSLCQSVIEQKLESNVELLYLYQTNIEEPQPHNEAINGFAKILLAESPRLRCKILEVVRDAPTINDDLLNIILSEFQLDVRYDLTVRHQQQERYVKQIKELNLDSNQGAIVDSVSHLRIKEKGVYIITGGAGGLGLIFAEYLAKECHARLLLTGRSKLSREQENKLEELRQFGAEILYIEADVSRHESVKNLIQESKSHFGEINGIIHSAGVLRDSYVRNKTHEEMKAVFAPKLYGTLHLDELTKNEDLDFFVMFSSLAALAGNAGQSDYSFANHFMDSFAHKRELYRAKGERSGKTLSLNWSIWAGGGMQLDEQTEQFFRKNLGIKPLSSETGLEAFIIGLGSNHTNFAVIEGVQEKIERAWGLIEEAPIVTSTSDSFDASSSFVGSGTEQVDGELTILVQNELSQIVMDFLKLDAEDVDLDSILLDLGFDSIGLATFANAVNEVYPLDVTPVLFFEYPNIREIAQYIAEEHTNEVLKVHQMSSTSSPAATAILPDSSNANAENQTPIMINKGWSPQVTEQLVNVIPEGSFSPELRFVQQPIAIVGASGVMPQSENLKEYWEKLKNAENNMVTEIPKDRWSWEEYYGDPLEEENKTKSIWGGFMKEIDKFDPLFWGISPREAEMMDPQQRIFLETVWNTIEDAGHKVSELSGTKTGLFVGAATRDYIDLMAAENAELDGYSASGTSHAILANRVSFLLNLHGPSAPLDTACSSSLVALHRAIESIHTGSCDMAIVGGVQVMLTAAAFISFGAAGMLASDGKCKTFDEKADGYVRGEGSGAIFIKPLSMAEADGNHIYALIKATAENHGGKATMLTAPNPNAQADLLVEAYEKAQIDPTTVGYIECHGTGTSLGDPIEIQAMKKAFAELYKKHNKGFAKTPHIGLTSAKTNIGHLETAAGIAGILKVLLSIKNKQIPALLHFEKLNPYINLKGTPFYMVDKTRPWDAIVDEAGNELPRRAGVSSFGFGGANVHVVLEEYACNQSQPISSTEEPLVFVLSAKNKERLKAYAHLMLTHLEKYEVNLINFAYTLQVGRDSMEERMGFVANSVEQLVRKLNAYVADDANDQAVVADELEDVYQGRVSRKKENLKADDNTINGWLADQNYTELLRVWVKGQQVDWNQIYTSNTNRADSVLNSKPKRISLPTYPFERERYWFDTKNSEQASTTATAAVLHPLLHTNTSVLSQQSYSSSFSGKEFFLKEQQVSFENTENSLETSNRTVGKVLPEIACLEMVREAITQATRLQQNSTLIELYDTTWGEPIAITENRQVSVALFEAENGQIDFEICSSEKTQPTEINSQVFEDTSDIIHCQGTAVLSPPTAVAKLDVEQLADQIGQNQLDINNLYDVIAKTGVNYDEPLRALKTIFLGEHQQLVQLSLPDGIESEQGEYVLHPSIMEGALQSTISLITDLNQPIVQPTIPFALEYLKVVSPCTSDMHAWVRYSRGSKVQDEILKLDIDLVDSKGKVCVTMKSLTFSNNYMPRKIKTQQSDFELLLDSIYDSSSNASQYQETASDFTFEELLEKLY